MVRTVEAKHNTSLLHAKLSEDPEFLKACQKALKDPEKLEQIICILQRAGLVQESDRRPA